MGAENRLRLERFDAVPDTKWFQPKTHGYGATPTSWQGWLVTAVYSLIMIVFSVLMLAAPGGVPEIGIVLAWLLMVSVFTTAFCLFVKSKTGGDWKWRWGEKK
jgi:hypothetical protein